MKDHNQNPKDQKPGQEKKGPGQGGQQRMPGQNKDDERKW